MGLSHQPGPRNVNLKPKKHAHVNATYPLTFKVSPTTLEDLFRRLDVEEEDRKKLLKSPRFARMTYEQYKIVNYQMRRGEVIKINAFAGTGWIGKMVVEILFESI